MKSVKYFAILLLLMLFSFKAFTQSPPALILVDVGNNIYPITITDNNQQFIVVEIDTLIRVCQ